MNEKSDRQKGILALVVLSILFASMGVFARYLSTELQVVQQVYLRVFSAFLFSVIFFRKDLNISKIRKISVNEWGLLLMRAIANYGLGITLFTQAIVIAKYSNVSFIGALPLSAVFGVILFHEKLNWQKALLVLTAFIGGLLIAVNDFSQILSWGKGEVLTFISTCFFAFAYVSRKWHTKLLNNQELTTLTILIGFLVLLFTSFILGIGLPQLNVGSTIIPVILIAGLFNTAIMFLINYGFQHIEAIIAGNVVMLESFFAILLGFFIYQEIPTLKEILGGIIIVASAIGMNSLKEKN